MLRSVKMKLLWMTGEIGEVNITEEERKVRYGAKVCRNIERWK